MNERFDKVEKKLDKILDAINKHRLDSENRLTSLEVSQKGFITIFTAALAGVIAYLVNLFNS